MLTGIHSAFAKHSSTQQSFVLSNRQFPPCIPKVIAHTHLVLCDIVRVPESHLEILAGWATSRFDDSDLHSPLCLILWSVHRPIRCVVTLLPPSHHELPVAVVVVHQTEIVVVDSRVHKEGARELETGEAGAIEEEAGARVESLNQLCLLQMCVCVCVGGGGGGGGGGGVKRY